jgi:hypothetical protein
MFVRGFTMTGADHTPSAQPKGVLQTSERPSTEAAAWRIGQWASRHLLQPGVCERVGTDMWQAVTPGKRVLVERAPDGPARLLLEVNGGAEYDGRMRASGESWPHLLIEQSFQKAPIRLDSVRGLPFTIEMRIAHCRVLPWGDGKLDPGLHTAQTSAYWTLNNVTPGSADFGEMIWFGIPLFDARHENPPAHYAIDGGQKDASGKFICVLDGKRFWSGNTGDRSWRKLDVDLLPLLREALAIAQEHGHLKQTRFEDLAITTFNLGWEVPGPYDAGLEIRGLSLKAKTE